MTIAEVDAARRLVGEYLDDVAGFDSSWASLPQLVLTAVAGDRVVGLCYGSRGSAADVVLQGILVDAPRAGRGLGSRLLAAWEQTAVAAGFVEASVGSAGGYVEHFYEKNGYRATEYLLTIRQQPGPQRPDGYDIIRVRETGGRTLVNVASTAGSDPVAKAAAIEAFGADEVNVIYAKPLGWA